MSEILPGAFRLISETVETGLEPQKGLPCWSSLDGEGMYDGSDLYTHRAQAPSLLSRFDGPKERYETRATKS